MRDQEWRLHSACRGEDPNLFTLPGEMRGQLKTDLEDAAKAVCRICPVRSECLDYALRIRDTHSVMGGMTADERKQMLAGPHRPAKYGRVTA